MKIMQENRTRSSDLFKRVKPSGYFAYHQV